LWRHSAASFPRFLKRGAAAWPTLARKLKIAQIAVAFEGCPATEVMFMKPLQALALGFIAALPPAPAAAHPHVWVSVETEVELGPGKEIVGFKHKWTFDEMYAEFATNGLDANGDGVYSDEELRPLAKTNVEALKEFEYFTFPFAGQTKLPLKDPSDYRLEYKDKALTLYFALPLETPLPYSEIKDFSFAVYDPGMYVSLTFNGKTAVTVASADPVRCSASVGAKPAAKAKEATLSQMGESIDPSSNIGSRFAERVRLDCRP
jgi:ABC-type uncharacterized transport system substrate-binding protein